MQRENFTVREEEFGSFVERYPNFLEQFKDITTLTAQGAALVFLQRGNGYAKNSQKTTDFSQWMNGIICWLFLHPKNA